MSTTPRSPRYWPRMKIRGRRRHALAAQRREHRYVIPYAHVTSSDNNQLKFTALAAAEPGAMRLEWSSWRDGFGRPVVGPVGMNATAVPQAEAVPVPEPRPFAAASYGTLSVAPPGTPYDDDSWTTFGLLKDPKFNPAD